MSLTDQDIARIAHLSRIALSPEERERARDQLNGILSLVNQLQAVDTQGVEPMFHAGDHGLRLRADAVTETNERERFQAIAPEAENGLYLVPKVIE
jgi:aspartyl-tRNA(Asn)/glutamyl-tRNA(Gln) amidotransferase subunit C